MCTRNIQAHFAVVIWGDRECLKHVPEDFWWLVVDITDSLWVAFYTCDHFRWQVFLKLFKQVFFTDAIRIFVQDKRLLFYEPNSSVHKSFLLYRLYQSVKRALQAQKTLSHVFTCIKRSHLWNLLRNQISNRFRVLACTSLSLFCKQVVAQVFINFWLWCVVLLCVLLDAVKILLGPLVVTRRNVFHFDLVERLERSYGFEKTFFLDLLLVD